jgi:diaminopimelate decarboxylase
MHHFQMKKGELFAEDVPLSTLTETYGTPLYVYSARTIMDHFDRLTAALAPLDHLICYALKANSNLAVLNLLAKRGSGFDLVSGGELTRVLKAGGKAAQCSFAGVGKTRSEIEQALAANVYVFNVESIAELEFINQIAGEKKKIAPVAIRVNPNVDASTHSKITTGTYENKFGIAFEEIGALYARAAKMKNLRLLGVQTHIGSQITEVKPFVQAIKKMTPLVQELKALYHLEFFDIGGGLGIVYDPALASGQPGWWSGQKVKPLTPASYGEQVVPLLKPLGLRILVEPGRFMVGNAGVLVTEVLYVKNTGKKTFVIVDAAMNDLIRPATPSRRTVTCPRNVPATSSRC